MLFNTIDFVVFFIFVCSVVAMIRYHKRLQHVFLLSASYFFFYYSSNYLLLLLVFSTVLDYYIAKKIWDIRSDTSVKNNSVKKKILLIISLSGNLGLLGFFKYADFAIMQFNILGNYFDVASEIPFLNIALPIGISFYTFQTISYTVDVYRGKLEPSQSLREFALFVAFFPQLVAGPILRASHFLPQLREKISNADSSVHSKMSGLSQRISRITITGSNLKIGITIMAFGFFKKMFFADNIAPLADQIFLDPVGMESFSIILGALAFGVQIYADFSGYSDIAIGAATILGFKIPMNFNKPYFAVSPSDFWRRWHISLSTWLRDYLYIPLGGNKKSQSREYLNLFAVMFLGGLWHGASWNFVIWGLLHGTYLAIHKAFRNHMAGTHTTRIAKFSKSRLGTAVSIMVTQYFVFLAWIPFRVTNVDFMAYAMHKYVFLDFMTQKTTELVSANKISVFLLGAFLLLSYISYKRDLVRWATNIRLRYWTLLLMSIAISILLLYDGHPEDFIYFRF